MINHLIPLRLSHHQRERVKERTLTGSHTIRVKMFIVGLSNIYREEEERLRWFNKLLYFFRMGVMAKKTIAQLELRRPLRLLRRANVSPSSIETHVKINIQNHYNLYNFFVNRQLIIMGDFSPRPHAEPIESYCSMTSTEKCEATWENLNVLPLQM